MAKVIHCPWLQDRLVWLKHGPIIHGKMGWNSTFNISYTCIHLFTKSEERFSLVAVVRCFRRVLENCDCRTKVNSSVGMEYNGELYVFSAVKVKLVDSLI